MVTKKPSGQEYRKQVDTYLKNQKSLYKEASKYKQEGLVKVAQFYSNLANKQALYYKRVIAQVVSIFLKVNSKGLPTNLLNLHYLRLNEAKKLVDEFLDNHINYLRKNSDKTKHELNIITGRGKHSPGGIPVLRPAIWNYLKKRALKIRLINQGSIRVHITANSKLTNELSQIS
ncbi:hypothetical protein GWI33_018029 [Rhynchophorus ferrugineus]|nr:hypothetical protein GWI33_018029 [Rhynchophorus ferrugineus]